MTDSRIVRIETTALAAPFETMFDDPADIPHWLRYPAASHSVLPRRGQYGTIVRIETADGAIGIGECYGLPAPRVTMQIVVDILGPLLMGEDAGAPARLWERMYAAQAAGGHSRGFYLEAMAGVDIALWDLLGKRLGVPVSTLLGGPIRDRIPTYASPVPLLDDPEESADAAMRFVDAGYRALKVKIGRGVRVDRAHLAAVRSAVGEDVEIFTDANCAYSIDEATNVASVLQDLGIGWFEEPLAVVDVRGLAELRRRTGLTIVTGETSFTRFDAREFFAAAAVDVYMPNVARSGGITESHRISALASAFHVDIAPHGVGTGVSLAAALQLCAATPNLRTYEHNRLPNALREAILVEVPALVDGALVAPTGPGLGIDIDMDVVDRFTIGTATA